MYKQQLRYAHALIGTNSRGKNASCRHRRRNVHLRFISWESRALFHKIFSNRSISSSPDIFYPLAVRDFNHPGRNNRKICSPNRFISYFFPFFFLSLFFLFLFTRQKSVRSDVQHRRDISKDNGLVMATVLRFEDEKKQGSNNIYVYICVYAPDNAPFGKCILFNVVQAFFSKVRT